MRRTILAAVLAAAAGGAEADPAAVQGVIGAQIEAFRADDFAGAFGYAGPGIVRMFRTPENFGRMVRQGYPMVHRPAVVEFGRSEAVGADWAQEVTIEDAQGGLHRLIYRMTETAEGWRIAGVSLVTLPEVGA